jgi:hypothetical protein
MFSLTRSYALLTVLLAGWTVGPSSLFAQEVVAPAQVTGVAAEVADAPAAPLATVAPAFTWGVRVAKAPFAEQAPVPLLDVLTFQDRARAGTNIAMMAVGGGALVTGLILGGDTGMIIATSGAVIGLVGLYRYLR